MVITAPTPLCDSCISTDMYLYEILGQRKQWLLLVLDTHGFLGLTTEKRSEKKEFLLCILSFVMALSFLYEIAPSCEINRDKVVIPLMSFSQSFNNYKFYNVFTLKHWSCYCTVHWFEMFLRVKNSTSRRGGEGRGGKGVETVYFKLYIKKCITSR